MSTNKNAHAESNGVAVLEPPVQSEAPALRFNFDALESLDAPEVEDESPVVDSESDIKIETEADILATVETFDSTFGSDPLKAKYVAFGTAAVDYDDPVDSTPTYIGLGLMAHDLMIAERNLAPSAYKRKEVVRKCENAIRIAGAVSVKTQELIAVFWLSKLERSTAAEQAGEPRTFASKDAPPDEWYGGNLGVAVLRKLAKLITRESDDEELDVWDFRDGYESFVRSVLGRLRSGELSLRKVEKLIDVREKQLAAQRQATEFAGLTADEVASIKESKSIETREKKLNELGAKAVELRKFASEELKMSKDDLRDMLANKLIIPPARMTPQEYAAQMTPADAKLIVQELIKLYDNGAKDRFAVFKSLYQTTSAIVAQMKSSQDQQKKAG